MFRYVRSKGIATVRYARAVFGRFAPQANAGVRSPREEGLRLGPGLLGRSYIILHISGWELG